MSKRCFPSTWEGTVSHGTMQPRDLIPTFLSALENVSKAAAQRLRGHYGYRPGKSVEDWVDRHQDQADYLLEALFDELDDRAPAGCSFGANEGDGSDYGFWSYGEDED